MIREERRLWVLADRATQYTEERNDLVRKMRAEGYTLRSLAEMTKLSHTAIAKICARVQ